MSDTLDITNITNILELKPFIKQIRGIASSSSSPSDIWIVELKKNCISSKHNKQVKKVIFKMCINNINDHQIGGLLYEQDIYKEINDTLDVFADHYNTFNCSRDDLVKLAGKDLKDNISRNGTYLKNPRKGERPSVTSKGNKLTGSNIVESSKDDIYSVLVIEYLDNPKTLDYFIHDRVRLDKKRCDLILQVMSGLNNLVDKNINHNDLHFDNILVVEQDVAMPLYNKMQIISSQFRVVLYDFDLAFKNGIPNPNTDQRRPQGFIPNKDLVAFVGELYKKGMDSLCLNILTPNDTHQKELMEFFELEKYPFILERFGVPLSTNFFSNINSISDAFLYITKFYKYEYYLNNKLISLEDTLAAIHGPKIAIKSLFAPLGIGTVAFMFLGGFPDPGNPNFEKWVEFFISQRYNILVVSHARTNGGDRNALRELNRRVTRTITDGRRFETESSEYHTPTQWGDSSLVRATLFMLLTCYMKRHQSLAYTFLVDGSSRPVCRYDISSRLTKLFDPNNPEQVTTNIYINGSKNMIQKGSQWVGLSRSFINHFFARFRIETVPKISTQYHSLVVVSPGIELEQKIADSVNGKNIICSGVLDECFFEIAHNHLCNINSIEPMANLYREEFSTNVHEDLINTPLTDYKIYRTTTMNYDYERPDPNYGIFQGVQNPYDTTTVPLFRPGLRTTIKNFSNKSSVLSYLEASRVTNLYDLIYEAKQGNKQRILSAGSSPIFTDWEHAQPTAGNLLRSATSKRPLQQRLEEFYTAIQTLQGMCKGGNLASVDPQAINDLQKTFTDLFKPFFWHPLEYTINETKPCPFPQNCHNILKQMSKVVFECNGFMLQKRDDFSILMESMAPLIILLTLYNKPFKGFTIEDHDEVLTAAFRTGSFFIRKVNGQQKHSRTTVILEPR